MEIQIPEPVRRKIMHWVNKSDNEVSGFGKVVWNKETKAFEVRDAYLMKQENGKAHTDIDPAALGKLMYTSKDVEGELKWWWHSHVNMDVFWSQTDKDTITQLGANGWITATVFNKKEEATSAVCYQSEGPFGVTLATDFDIQTMYLQETDEAEIAAWDKEYNDNVTERKYLASAYYSGVDTPPWISDYDKDPVTGVWTKKAKKDNSAPRTTALTSDEYMTPSEAATEMAYYKKEGYMGFGASKEARALGMTTKAYLDAVVYGSTSDLRLLEDKLSQLMETGVLA